MEICFSKEIGETRRLFNSVTMKSSISVLALASAKLAVIGALQERPSAALCLWPRKYLTSKSNSWIQAIHQVTKALDKSILNWFNYATKTFATVFRINLTLYSQYLTFFKAFKTPQYSRLIALYFFSTADQILLSYLKGCRFLLTSYINTSPHPSKLA